MVQAIEAFIQCALISLDRRNFCGKRGHKLDELGRCR
jgi:hypothetical protein